jgi:MFS family permease
MDADDRRAVARRGAWAWVVALVVAGLGVFVWFVRYELRQKDPAVDIRVLRRPEMWPVQATAFLVGISLLGAGSAVDLRRHRSLSATAWGWMPRALQHHRGLPRLLIVGAVVFASRRDGEPAHRAHRAALLVGVGYALFLPFHRELWQVLLNLSIAGLGCGALVGALPAAAAAAAPTGRPASRRRSRTRPRRSGDVLLGRVRRRPRGRGGAVASQTAASSAATSRCGRSAPPAVPRRPAALLRPEGRLRRRAAA